jgi:prolyl-tRNA synthetase
MGHVVLARRDTGTKSPVALAAVTEAATTALDAIHAALFDEATTLQQSRTVTVTSVEEAVAAAATGFAVIPVAALGPDGETTLNRAGLSIRCIHQADGSLPGPLTDAGSSDEVLLAVVARAY